MSTHDTIVKILELKELEKELSESCHDNCTDCRDKVKERIRNLIIIIGKDFIENPQLLRNHQMMIRIQELNSLENLLCDLCHGICGECKAQVKTRLIELCDILDRDCDSCPCK